MLGKTREAIAETTKRFSKPLAPVTRFAHRISEPVHLVYFFAIAAHWDYASAALVCLVVGIIALVPAKDHKKEGE
jgi:hypothetical protein